MSKVPSSPFFPAKLPELANSLGQYWRDMAAQVNASFDGRIAAKLALDAAPTTGTWAIGDFVRNTTPAEAGSSPDKYIILGWVCVASGSPGTWKECRVLTGA